MARRLPRIRHARAGLRHRTGSDRGPERMSRPHSRRTVSGHERAVSRAVASAVRDRTERGVGTPGGARRDGPRRQERPPVTGGHGTGKRRRNMKAARFYGREDIRIEEAAEPSPGPGQVKLRNAFAGICGSDLHFFFYPESLPFSLDEPHPLTGATLPQILGHEFSGTVVETGEGVTDVRVGDRCAVFPLAVSCGKCAACRRGLPFSCPLMGSLGSNVEGGGLSEFTVCDASKVHVLPAGVDLRMGALVEPMAVGWHAVARSGVRPGGSALVAGAGPIGIGAWFAFKARGVEKVLVSEPSEDRRAIMATLGARVIDPVNEDLADAVASLTDGDGVDAAVDAAGAGAAVTSAMAGLVPGGRLVVAALHEHTMDFQPTRLMMGETEIVGAVGYRPEEFDEVIAAMADGFYDTTGWVRELPLESLVDALHSLRHGIGGKTLLRLG
ncbi:alcohol dehydrogenase catalytic domain-containing protein [Streptomyces sp. IPPR8]|uniref:alcohol dehydrogenase catalytic domain-containing protein n=1 Tax=Streptomyces TaxID=1883 RepID=UPI003788DE5C